jgi:hypothetical protein
MKKILTMVLALLSISAISKAEDNIELSISRDSLTQWTLTVALNNESTKYAGFQMDIVLPQQFSVDATAVKKGARMINITMEANILESGNLRVVGYGATAKKYILNSSGTILTIPLTCTTPLPLGEKTVTFKNIRFSSGSDETVFPGTSINFTVEALAKHTINYWDGEKLLKTVTVEEGASIPAVDAPTAADGYAFDGWSDSTKVMPDHDLDIYAKWKKLSYTVNYWNGETLFKTLTVVMGDSIPKVDIPEAADGYTFDGWSDSTAVMPTHNLDIYAKWKKLSYTINYWDGEKLLSTITLSAGETIPNVVAPEGAEGYTFDGWSDSTKVMPTHNLDIYAKWKKQSYTISYVVNGTTVHTETVTYGDEVTPYDYTPDKGYRFIKWTGDSYDTMPAKDITYEAQVALIGDVNLDGKITSADVVSIYNYIIDSEGSGVIEACADVDGNDEINSADVIAVYNIIINGTAGSQAYSEATIEE